MKSFTNMKHLRNSKGQFKVRHWEYLALAISLIVTFICYQVSIAQASDYDDDQALFPKIIAPVQLDEIYGIKD